MCSDPETPWYPQRSTCYADATRTSVGRKMNDYYKRYEPTEKNGWVHPQDGTSYWVSPADLSPGDDFDGAYPVDG